MKTRFSALVAAVALGAAAVTPALAIDGRMDGQSPYAGQPQYMGLPPGVDAPVVIVDQGGPTRLGCPENSAAEGNANQQTREVPQYGQTSGGSAC